MVSWIKIKIRKKKAIMIMKGESDKPKVHPLECALSQEQVGKLSEYWIETPEQFLSAVATPAGRAGMQKLLSMDDAQMKDCCERLSRGLSEQRLKQISSVEPGGMLGAILPDMPSDHNDID